MSSRLSLSLEGGKKYLVGEPVRGTVQVYARGDTVAAPLHLRIEQHSEDTVTVLTERPEFETWTPDSPDKLTFTVPFPKDGVALSRRGVDIDLWVVVDGPGFDPVRHRIEPLALCRVASVDSELMSLEEIVPAEELQRRQKYLNYFLVLTSLVLVSSAVFGSAYFLVLGALYLALFAIVGLARHSQESRSLPTAHLKVSPTANRNAIEATLKLEATEPTQVAITFRWIAAYGLGSHQTRVLSEQVNEISAGVAIRPGHVHEFTDAMDLAHETVPSFESGDAWISWKVVAEVVVESRRTIETSSNFVLELLPEKKDSI